MYILLFLGVVLSIILMEITSDEYFVGQTRLRETFSSFDSAIFNKTESNLGERRELDTFELSFYNLECAVKSSNGILSPVSQIDVAEKPILNKVSGRIRPGRLTTILGQSGSGKSTFIQKLLGRTKSFCSTETGDVFINGQLEWNGLESVLDKVGYVPQHDVLYSELTVLETVMFSAQWRLPKSMSADDKKEIVLEVLRLLNLEHIKDEKIGNLRNYGYGYRQSFDPDATTRISGGERKRTSIAVELVAQPKVLLMDEPTSGLDSTSALNLMKILNKISKMGVTVVAVLHQPSERMFKLVDDVILLEQGEAAYVGSKESLVGFLKDVGYSQEHLVNAETILDVLAGFEMPVSSPHFDLDSMISEFKRAKSDLLGKKIKSSTDDEFVIQDFSKEDLAKCFGSFESGSCWNSRTQTMHPRLPVLFRTVSKLNRKSSLYEDTQKHSAVVQHSLKSTSKPRTLFHVTGPDIKPGFKTQSKLWIKHLLKLSLRKHMAFEIFSIVLLATVVGFVSGYNRSWSRKPMANLFLTMSVGLLGILGTVYGDDMEPVRRAADSGMILGAHEIALLTNNLLKGWLVCQLFSFCYFIALYIKTGVFVYQEEADFDESWEKFFNWRKFHKFYEFAHINHLNYSVSAACGSAICVFANHDLSLSNVLAIAVLISSHVFASFCPNENQLRRDSLIFGVDLSSVFLTLSRLSYVTYYLEAIFLWDPETNQERARRLVMRYYAYQEGNKNFDCHCIFALWGFFQVVRYLVFVIRNSNEFHSINDTPLFFVFIGKVLTCHLIAWMLMTVFQDIYLPFVSKLQRQKEKIV